MVDSAIYTKSGFARDVSSLRFFTISFCYEALTTEAVRLRLMPGPNFTDVPFAAMVLEGSGSKAASNLSASSSPVMNEAELAGTASQVSRNLLQNVVKKYRSGRPNGSLADTQDRSLCTLILDALADESEDRIKAALRDGLGGDNEDLNNLTSRDFIEKVYHEGLRVSPIVPSKRTGQIAKLTRRATTDDKSVLMADQDW